MKPKRWVVPGIKESQRTSKFLFLSFKNAVSYILFIPLFILVFWRSQQSHWRMWTSWTTWSCGWIFEVWFFFFGSRSSILCFFMWNINLEKKRITLLSLFEVRKRRRLFFSGPSMIPQTTSVKLMVYIFYIMHFV